MSGHRSIGVYTPRSRKGQIADAVASFRAWLSELVAETARRSIGLVLILVATALFLALASYDPADPSLQVATGRAPANWLGPIGSYAADAALQAVGAAAFVILVPFAAWGWQLLRGHRLKELRWRLAAVALGALFLSAGLGGFPPVQSIFGGAGGIIGHLANTFTLKIGNTFGAPWLSFVIPPLFGGFGLVLIFLGGAIGWRSIRAFLRLSHRWLRHTGRGLRHAAVSIASLRVHQDQARIEPWTDAEEPLADEEEEPLEFDEADEPEAPRDSGTARGPRVHRQENRVKPKGKGGAQRALSLAEGEYHLPPLGLLTQPPNEKKAPAYSDDALEENARLLEAVLGDFGVRGRIVAVRPGPVVTLYELEPAAGVKSSRVISLSDDIARSMSAVAARVAVIPGRNVIGVELPNQRRETVYLRELFSARDYEKSAAPLTLALGKTIGGEPVMADLAKMPHLLIAGTTGSGKSVALNTMILSLLYRMPPETCRIIMIDPKMLELSVYEGIPHLLAPVVIDPKKAVVALKWAVREMEQRYGKMAKIGVRGVEAFNERVRRASEKGEVLKRTVQTGFDHDTGKPVFEDEILELEPMPFIVVVVDEMADLMMISGKEIEGAVQRLAQMARAAGIHLIAATQRPSVDVITGTIKANFPTRISFQVTSKIDSRTILGEQGAEQLLGQGDMLYMMAGGRIRRVHGPFVSDGEVEEVVRFLKTQGRPDYLDAVTEEPDEDEDDPYGLMAGGEGGDDLFDKAVAIVARERKVSTSYIQRRLQIGYNRAARLIERMEHDGMISKPNHQGKREIMLPEGRE
jgi:S-DNA-T family DNA segregation ATPase FtsK/SpoIIIE